MSRRGNSWTSSKKQPGSVMIQELNKELVKGDVEEARDLVKNIPAILHHQRHW
jgi:hypothetical protein